MMSENLLMAVPLLFIVAALYSSVGHGGASGYLAVFSLIGVTMAPLVPVVLSLNILVASISFLHFRKPGNFSFARLLPFIITSIPAAYVGGMWKLGGIGSCSTLCRSSDVRGFTEATFDSARRMAALASCTSHRTRARSRIGYDWNWWRRFLESDNHLPRFNRYEGECRDEQRIHRA
jgi:hypothetical protein